ncbi:hypothetical protein KEJ37_07275 [Candidatus Bathyarchaeota archaeon]|nr:hypothetical protein [Candidatus Bathyarchaeota archaeon]
MSMREVFRVIYAPHKAFREIIQNPKYVGPIITMILFIAANFALSYTLLSKQYIDETKPNGPSENFDLWTEEASYWDSIANITVNTNDFINVTYPENKGYYGKRSIEFKINSSNHVWMELNFREGFPCSGSNGYKNLTLRIKIVKPSETLPSNVSIYLISGSQGLFYQDITTYINYTDVWNNVTLSLGDVWKPLGSANWNNITGLKLEFSWFDVHDNITLRIDGLFFHGLYRSQIETSNELLISLLNPYSPFNAFMQFTIQWVFLGGLLYLIPKVFGAKTVWKPLLIAAGFILIVYFVRIIIFTLVHITSPNIYLSFSYLGRVSGEWQRAEKQILEPFGFHLMLLWVLDKIIWIWVIALCAILIHSMLTLPWRISIFAALSSFVFYMFLLILFTPSPPILL